LPSLCQTQRIDAHQGLALPSLRSPLPHYALPLLYSAILSAGLALPCNSVAKHRVAMPCPCGSHRRCDYQVCALAVLCQSRLSYAIAKPV
jgi:hypothetical protein